MTNHGHHSDLDLEKKFPTHLEYFVLMQVHCVQESIIPFYAKGESCILNRVSFMSIVKF